ncbi:MAG: insulinase family protein [Parcubacteria group bacterium]|nr:insulinase family protein [Parcubacteria group bacterium]
MFKKTTLKNGFRIITAPMPGAKNLTVLVMAGVGSRYENKKNNGLSHFLEHMMFKGTVKRPQAIDISKELDSVGAIYNAFTSKEYTGYFVKAAAQHDNLILDVISDIFLNSTLKKEEIDRERNVIIEEINSYLDDPDRYIGFLFERLLYGDQPVGWDIAGQKENIRKIQHKDFVKYLSNFYRAKNVVVIAAGAVTDSFIPKIDDYFSGIRPGASPQKAKVIEKQNRPEGLMHFRKDNQAQVSLGVRAYSLNHPWRFGLDLLSTILGNGMSSRMFIKIRERKGLAYTVFTDYSEFSDSGYLTTYVGLAPKNAEQAINLILEEYRDIAQNGVGEEELKKAKEFIKGRLSLNLETSNAVAIFLGMQELQRKEILSPKEFAEKIDAVSASDIQKIAKDIFRPEKLNLALIGPFKKKDKFLKLLNKF